MREMDSNATAAGPPTDAELQRSSTGRSNGDKATTEQGQPSLPNEGNTYVM